MEFKLMIKQPMKLEDLAILALTDWLTLQAEKCTWPWLQVQIDAAQPFQRKNKEALQNDTIQPLQNDATQDQNDAKQPLQNDPRQLLQSDAAQDQNDANKPLQNDARQPLQNDTAQNQNDANKPLESDARPPLQNDAEQQINDLRQELQKEADDVLSSRLEILRNYFYSIPKDFHDKLMVQAIKSLSMLKKKMAIKVMKSYIYLISLKKPSTVVNIVGRIMEVLFTEKLTTLELNNEDITTFELSFGNANRLTGLTNLTINYYGCDADSKIYSDVKKLILQILKVVHNLKYLKLGISMTIDDDILKCIADNCKFVEELDFRSSDINSGSLHILNQMPNLKTFHLNESLTSICFQAVLNCEQIENVLISATSNSRLIGKIQEIASQIENSGKLIKLKTYSGVSNTLDHLEMIANMCPMIEKISLYKYNEAFTDLSPLVGMKNVRQLNLTDYEFYTHKVKEVLTGMGSNLTSLSLIKTKQMDLNALIHISQTCPDLECLVLINCNFENSVLEYNENELAVKPFENLKRLYLIKDYYMHVDQDNTVVPDLIAFLLTNCLNVEFVKIVYRDMKTAIDGVDLSKLKYLKEMEVGIHGRATNYTTLWENDWP